MRRLVVLVLGLLTTGSLMAEEVAPAPAPAPPEAIAAPAPDPVPAANPAPVAAAVAAAPAIVAGPPPKPEGWSYGGKLGVWFQNTSGSNTDTSLDPAISSTTNAISYKFGGDANALWKRGINEVEQNLVAAYGRQKQQGTDWTTSTDNVLYNGIYRTVWSAPQFTYVGWGVESVFVGPGPSEDAFGQGRAWSDAGYGLKGGQILVPEDNGEARIGVRAQEKWGPNYTEQEKELQVGPEAFGRYDVKVKSDTKAFVQYEAFGDFSDMGHITNLITAGLFVQISRYLTLDVAFRAYYESRPDDAPVGATGYSQWSTRSETLVGAVYTF